MEVRNFGLRYGGKAEFLNFFAEVLGHQRLDNFLLQLVGKAAANQTCRRLSPAESRHSRHLLVTHNQRFKFARDSIGRNVNGDLALAFTQRTLLVPVLVFVSFACILFGRGALCFGQFPYS